MKKVLLPLFAAAMLTACSNEDMPQTAGQGGEGDNVEIKMSTTALDIDVKKPFTDDISSGNPLKALVVVSETQNDYTTFYSKGTMTFVNDGGSVAQPFDADGLTGKRTYPAGSDDKTLYVRGFYPSTWSPAANNATFTVDGKTDVMATTEYTTTKGQAKENTYPALAFNHLLTQLIIKVQADDAGTVGTEVNKIELVGVDNTDNVPTTCTYTYATNTVEFSGTAGPLAAYKTGTDDAFTSQTEKLTTEGAVVAYVLCPAITNPSSNTDYKLKVSYAGTETTVPIDLKQKGSSETAFTGSTAGYAFNVTLNFIATEIKATATVTDWLEGGETTVDVE